MADAVKEIVGVAEETLRVDKQDVLTGRVRVRTETAQSEELVKVSLQTEAIEVTRVSVNRQVSEPPPVRTEGDVTIVPVLEEVAVIETRLILKEELHIRRTATTEEAEITVQLRKQHAVVEHETLNSNAQATGDDK